MPEDDDDQLLQQWYDEKSRMMESLLGPEHGMVMHAMIPYAVGGGLDLFYYPGGIAGTAIATKELSELPGEGSENDVFACYELAMFTRRTLSMDDALDPSTPFGKVHENINLVLNVLAPYSAEAVLNPGNTCSFPEEMEQVGGKCFVLDRYGDSIGEELEAKGDGIASFGLMVVIEILPAEMDYALEEGGIALLEKLKQAGHYPYSDLDREPVV
ncbi:suppressor of fused domain protein [Blastopirellula marina]|uniref:Uncharacterized protein n=1 Tax=Blastopirellula marina TaxID=124 RepID=A0A2S8G2E4_9BACT|nr:suppressor of fused domain protein [Blastopirellula marina]PQO38618.1 hypothetical protein C5Y98_11275 [Blastopirellula marina]PTL45275.1 hypothetical protein C5Y97_11285 [Blastopirellula marina]